MSGFSAQRQQLQKALMAAGLSADSAIQIANILGNNAQELRHAGPVIVDSTPPGLRMVDADARKLQFPNLDHREADPDHRQRRVMDAEQRPTSDPDPNVVDLSVTPQADDAHFRVGGGTLTDVSGTGQAAKVSVRNTIAGRPPAGLPVALVDGSSNRIVAKSPRATIGPNDGSARFVIEENAREVVWNLQMTNRSEYDVVTDVRYRPGKGLEVTYSRIKAWDERESRTDTIPVTRQPVVTEIVDDRKGTRGRRRLIECFSSRGWDNSYFNTFRIGKFTGAWEIGQVKPIEQVWPDSELLVDVMNMTHEIADTDEEKHVLFAARTKDAVPPPPEDPLAVPEPETIYDDPSPITEEPPLYNVNGEYIEVEPDGVNEPEVEWIALEIQHAAQCDTFSSLTGKRAQDLEDFDPERPSALSYSLGEDPPCLHWLSHTIAVVTDATLAPEGLVLTRKNIYVLGESDEEVEPIIIPVTDCPPPSPPDPDPEPEPDPDPPPSGGD